MQKEPAPGGAVCCDGFLKTRRVGIHVPGNVVIFPSNHGATDGEGVDEIPKC